jgi:hypothetical protein
MDVSCQSSFFSWKECAIRNETKTLRYIFIKGSTKAKIYISAMSVVSNLFINS